MPHSNSKPNNPDSGISDFVIKVIPGDVDSWQGRMKHVQSGRTYSFCSYLEMIGIIQAELERCGSPREEDGLRTWLAGPVTRLIRRVK